MQLDTDLNSSIFDVVITVTFLDAVHLSAEAWKHVKPQSIVTYF